MTNLFKNLKLSMSNPSIPYRSGTASMLNVFLAHSSFPSINVCYHTIFEVFVFTLKHCSHLAYSMTPQTVALLALTEHQSNSTGLGT